jgi:hypothetical protein
MKKTIVAVTSAIAIAAAAIPASSPASAHPALLIPAIIAAGAAVGVGTAAAANSERPVVPYGYGAAYPASPVVPSACHPARERIRGVWRRVEICP